MPSYNGKRRYTYLRRLRHPAGVLFALGALAACGGYVEDPLLPDESGAENCGDGVCDDDEQGACLADCSQGDSTACGQGALTIDDGGISLQSWDFAWDTEDSGYSLLSQPIVIAVPDDVSALTVSIEHRGETTGFDRVRFNDVLVATSYEEPALTVFDGDSYVATLLMPNNERTRLTEGCLYVEPYANGSFSGEEFTVTVGMRRGSPGTTLGVNIAIIGGTEITDAEIEEAINVVDAIYAGGGAPAIGAVDLYEVEGPSVVDAEGTELDDIRAASYDSPDRINIILVSSFTESGTLGIASGIPAPPFSGTASSGLVIAVDEHLNADGTALDTQMLGETIAHELGHMMGLFHTTEAEGGEYDVIADTARCPDDADDGDGEFTAEECADYDGRNLMFWTAGEFSQTQLSSVQAEILRAYLLSQ